MQLTESFRTVANRWQRAIGVRPHNAIPRPRLTRWKAISIRLIFHRPVVNSLDLRFVVFHYSVIGLCGTIPRDCEV
jgi:hypothetical protein